MLSPPPFAEANVASMKLSLVDRAFLAQCIGRLGEDVAQDLAVAPLLKAAMHCSVVRMGQVYGRL
jgi:hypothetical protein